MIRDLEALKDRADHLEGKSLNGFKLVLVTLDPSSNQAYLKVHFQNNNLLASIMDPEVDPKSFFRISGGHRILAGEGTEQVKVTSVQDDDPTDMVLELTVEPIGDYSTYTLKVDYSDMDPLFSEIEFKFRPGCFNIDCHPEWESALEPKPSPLIDYLAKDYDSFRHTMISWMMRRVPGWKPTSEADLDQVILELFSVAADELSDFQDRVMNEAYFGTARKRVSLARHARLMDYHIHQGNQASTWLALKLADGQELELPTDIQTWTGNNEIDSSAAIFINREEERLLALFNLDLKFIDELNSGNISNDFKHEFKQHGIIIGLDSLAVTGVDGGKWWITDNYTGGKYFIIKRRSRLKVFAPNKRHYLFNRMGLYTWRDSVPALGAGSTQADLKIFVKNKNLRKRAAITAQNIICEGNAKNLLIQEMLNPLTGGRPGRDPNKRQLLKLRIGKNAAKAMKDPLTKDWYVRVQWEEKDRLRNNYCFTVTPASLDGKVENISLFFGNLIEVHYGRRVNTIFYDPHTLPDTSEHHYFEKNVGWGTVCKLPEGPLAYRATSPGGEVPPRSTLAVRGKTPDGIVETWDEVISLVSSRGNDNHFVVETDENEKSLIRFGNGTNGKSLPDGAELRCSYQVGHGSDGNIGAEKLINFNEADLPTVEECWNPFPVTNGRGPEPVEEIIRRVPEAYRRRQLRAVCLKDYQDRAEELREVSRAAAKYIWTGSWRGVHITIDPAGATELTPAIRKKIAHHLDAVRLIGEDLEIRPPRLVPLEIYVSLCLRPDFWPADVKFLLEMEFSEDYTSDGRQAFFHPDQWTFGQALRASQIIGRIQSVPGVDHVISVDMKRWNEATPGTHAIIEVRPEEILQVKNDPDHMEKGFISFEVGGGRG